MFFPTGMSAKSWWLSHRFMTETALHGDDDRGGSGIHLNHHFSKSKFHESLKREKNDCAAVRHES